MSRLEGVDPRNILPGRRTALPSARLLNTDNDAEQLGIHKESANAARNRALEAEQRLERHLSDADDTFIPGSPPQTASEPDIDLHGRSGGQSGASLTVINNSISTDRRQT